MNYELNQQQFGPRYCLQGYTTTGKLQKPPQKTCFITQPAKSQSWYSLQHVTN